MFRRINDPFYHARIVPPRPNTPQDDPFRIAAQRLMDNLKDCQKKNVDSTKQYLFFYIGLFFFLLYPFAMVGLVYLAISKALQLLSDLGWRYKAILFLKVFMLMCLVSYFACISALYGNSILRFLRKKSQISKKVYKLYQNVWRANQFSQKFHPAVQAQETNDGDSRYKLFMKSVVAETFEHIHYNAVKIKTLHQNECDFGSYCSSLKRELKKTTITHPSIASNIFDDLNQRRQNGQRSWSDFNAGIAEPFLECLEAKEDRGKIQKEYFVGLVGYMEAIKGERVADFVKKLDYENNPVEKIIYYQYEKLDKSLLDLYPTSTSDQRQDAKNIILLRIDLRAWRWVKLFLWQSPFWPRVIGVLSEYINPLVNGIICFFSARTILETIFHWQSMAGVWIVAILCAIIGFICSHFTTAKACIKRFCRAQRWYLLSQYWEEKRIQPYMWCCLVIAGLMAIGSVIISYFAVSHVLAKISFLTTSWVNIFSVFFGGLAGICAFGLYLGSAFKLCSKQSFFKTLKTMGTSRSFWFFALPGALANSGVIFYTLYTVFPVHSWLFYLLIAPVVLCSLITLTLVYTQEDGDIMQEVTKTASYLPLPSLDNKADFHLGRRQGFTPTAEYKDVLDEFLKKDDFRPTIVAG